MGEDCGRKAAVAEGRIDTIMFLALVPIHGNRVAVVGLAHQTE
jgi:hypothetical protein